MQLSCIKEDYLAESNKYFKMNNEELIFDAIDAYYRFCKRNNYVYLQPCRSSTEVTWKYVYLYNINGLLAKYNRRTKKIIV